MVVICFSFVNCSKSYATREIQTSTLNIAKKSDYIVVARCMSSESKWDERKALIFTYTTFSVDEYINGDGLSEEISLRIIGGQVGDRALKFPDRPEFSEGQEFVLFLEPKNKYGFYNLKSLKNGVLSIKTDETTGKKIITTPTTGIKMFEMNTSKAASQLPQGGVLLEDFIYSTKKVLE